MLPINKIFETIQNLPNNPLNILTENEPTPEDSLGVLCEKLSSVTIQMFHNQEILYQIRKLTIEEFKLKYENDLENLHNIIKRCCDLNVQRARLMDAIDIVLIIKE